MATHFDNELCLRYRFFRAMQASVFCEARNGFRQQAESGHGKPARGVLSAVLPDGRTNAHFHSELVKKQAMSHLNREIQLHQPNNLRQQYPTKDGKNA